MPDTITPNLTQTLTDKDIDTLVDNVIDNDLRLLFNQYLTAIENELKFIVLLRDWDAQAHSSRHKLVEKLNKAEQNKTQLGLEIIRRLSG